MVLLPALFSLAPSGLQAPHGLLLRPQAPWPSEVNSGSPHWRLKPLHFVRFMPGPAQGIATERPRPRAGLRQSHSQHAEAPCELLPVTASSQGQLPPCTTDQARFSAFYNGVEGTCLSMSGFSVNMMLRS